MIDSNISIAPLCHYSNDSSNAEWLREQITMESEGERSPAQAPHSIVMDPRTPSLLRRQAS